jgi:hypothetical protein
MLMATLTMEVVMAERMRRPFRLRLVLNINPLEAAIRSLSMEETDAACAYNAKVLSTLLELTTTS